MERNWRRRRTICTRTKNSFHAGSHKMEPEGPFNHNSHVRVHSFWNGSRGQTMPLSKRLVAEFFGTFWLVFGGCGSAVLAAAFPKLGIGWISVSLAFGL